MVKYTLFSIVEVQKIKKEYGNAAGFESNGFVFPTYSDNNYRHFTDHF